MRPIGVVRSVAKQPSDDCWARLISTIELYPDQFTPESTAGLEHFSHVEVVFLFDRQRQTDSRYPRERPNWPKVGIFAQRAKDRPDRIGTTICKIGRVDGLQISVRVLDVARMKRRILARNLLLRSTIDESRNLVVQVHAVLIVQVHHVPR
jgi:tRNA (Thr-GGU) A37 N-methylase